VNDARLLWLLDAGVSNSYPVPPPNYAKGTFHFHKDLTNLMDGFMRTYGNGSWFGKQLFRKMDVQYTRTCENYTFPENVATNFWVNWKQYSRCKGTANKKKNSELRTLNLYSLPNTTF
jgi:hypothetical protein